MAPAPRDIVFRIAPFGGALYRATALLRERLLRRPLGLALSEKDVEGEEGQIHITACDASTGEVLGTVVLKPVSESVMKLRQLAVDSILLGGGLGRRLVTFAEDTALRQGAQEMETHARLTARGFYEKLGYTAHGEPFTEVTVQTIRMVKALYRL